LSVSDVSTERPKDHQDPALPSTERKSVSGGGVAVYQEGAGHALAGPGTGRAVSSSEDARGVPVFSFEVADFVVPTGREEAWKFTPLARLRGLQTIDPGAGAAADAPSKIVVDVDAPAGVSVDDAVRGDTRLGRAMTPADRVSAAAWQGFESATVIGVKAGAAIETPIFVTVRGDGVGGPAYGHLVVDLGAQAEATVIVDYAGSATFADNVEIVLGDGAILTLVSVQEWATDAVHLGAQGIRVGRDARLRVFQVTLGGDLVRLTTNVEYAGPGGDVELYGLTFADAGQHLESRLFVDHGEPNCRSRVSYKVALQGAAAHTVWTGDVLIRPTAIGTDTYESNRNLLLTAGARADSVPNLEILTGEIVGAGHASTTGRFDDEQLFYLQSRGIPAVEARRIVVRAFFAEIIDKLGVEALQERLLRQIDDELERVS
jgi:Fe-S cluster assembly protein SufD